MKLSDIIMNDVNYKMTCFYVQDDSDMNSVQNAVIQDRFDNFLCADIKITAHDLFYSSE